MSPPSIDAEVTGRRLRAIRDSLDVLVGMGPIDSDRLRSDPVAAAAAERLLQVCVDLAIDVNVHVVVARTGRAPSTGRESFVLAGEVGLIPEDLAAALAPLAGLRNVLVHRYLDIDPALVADAVKRVDVELPEYVRAVAASLRDAGPS